MARLSSRVIVFDDASQDGSNGAQPKNRCGPQLIVSGTDGQSTELSTLLRSRLRLVALIGLVPLVFYSVLRVLEPEESTPVGYRTFGLIFMGLLVALQFGLTALLWTRRCLSSCQLRRIELLMFGSVVAYFAFMQFCQIRCGHFLHWSQPGSAGKVFHVMIIATTLRWFFIIVLYGVLIPNTWRRCAANLSFAVLLPLVVTLITGLTQPRVAPLLLSPMLMMTVLLLAAFAVAIFGSHRIHCLHQQASEARQLGQYRLLRKIGAGGMGEVHLAEHVLLRRQCAVKLIRRNQEIDDVLLARFEREVQTMAKLTHWNTVDVFDYGRAEDGTFYYVMEHLHGMNLEQLVQRHGPLSPGRVVHLLRQVCQALREAHSLGFLHRDIKPSNVIVCQLGGVYDVVKLLDFGLVHDRASVQRDEHLTMHGTILGSPQYVSPEQARGRRDLQPASDTYSLGGVAYFLLTGQPPYVRETVMELLMAHASDKIVAPRELDPNVPEDLERIVLRCLEKKPEDRFGDVAGIERALAACSCADAWTDDDAAQWWAERSVQEAAEKQEKPALHEAVTTVLETAAT